jgi:tetratricopeptide (TPR) repeat protein
MGVVERALGGASTAKQLADLRKVVASDSKDTRSLLRLADLELKTGHASEACEAFSRAGDLFVLQGFARRAISAFTQGLDVARENALVDRVAPLARGLWKLYVNEKLPREALSTIDGASRWLIERGFDAHALPLLQARLELEDSDVARVRLAETLFRLGEGTRASNELVTVFMRLYAQKRRDEALDVAERLLGDRKDKEIARAAAGMYVNRNRPGDAFLAIAKLRICCEEDPTDVPTLDLLARAFELAGHPDKATRVRGEIEFLRGGGKSKAAKVPRPDGSKRAKLPAAAKEKSVAKPLPTKDKEKSVAKPLPTKDRQKSVAKALPTKDREKSVAKAPPRPTPKAKPPIRREESVSISIDIDEAWDDMLAAKQSEPSSPASRIDPSRASFWAVEEGPTTTEGSVCDLSVADVELVSVEKRESGPQPVSFLETALECIEALMAQGRYDEALVMVGRYLVTRPNNPLLLERKAEIEEMQTSHTQGPPPALYGFNANARQDSERSIQTRTIKASLA